MFNAKLLNKIRPHRKDLCLVFPLWIFIGFSFLYLYDQFQKYINKSMRCGLLPGGLGQTLLTGSVARGDAHVADDDPVRVGRVWGVAHRDDRHRPLRLTGHRLHLLLQCTRPSVQH